MNNREIKTMNKCEQEAIKIKDILKTNLPTNWDGKECITEMHAAETTHWRQMEWIGWYFQWKAFDLLTMHLGGTVGGAYGNSGFDYHNDCVWDFKAHVSNSGKPWAILNDSLAIEECIAEHGSVGFIVAEGPAFYNDIEQTFKKWHSEFSGDPSKYVLKGREEGRRSRRRKTLFVLGDVVIFRLDTETLSQGMEERWLKGFQQNMRNSNDKPRKGKVQIHLGNMPASLILG